MRLNILSKNKSNFKIIASKSLAGIIIALFLTIEISARSGAAFLQGGVRMGAMDFDRAVHRRGEIDRPRPRH